MSQGAARASALAAFAAAVLATFVTASAGAQTSRNLSQVERDRRAESARAERLRTEATAARQDVSGLDGRLVESAGRRAETVTAALAAEERLAALQQQIATDDARRRNARDGFENALIAAAFSARRLEPRAVRTGIFARAAAPALCAEERARAAAIEQAHELSSDVAEERGILAEAQTMIEAERTQIASLLARRRSAQTRLAQDADAAERRVRALTAEARSLRELAQRVQPASAPRRGPSVIPATWLAPAEGRVVRGFGVRESGGAASQGIALRTRAGAQVVAPAGGRVAYAGPFRSYGQVLILSLEGGYAVVLTGLDRVQARVGDTVRAGQPVGEMPALDTLAPELYVEVRRDGQPVDPGRWLGARALAAERNVRAG